MNILDQIVAHKEKEIDSNRELFSEKLLKTSIHFEAPTVSLKKYLLSPQKNGIIAEFKRKSPSRQWINQYASVEKVSIGYMQTGASALSILTDQHFFGAQQEDIKIARAHNFCPILRKDFIIHPYQVIESRSLGADAILLIASILSDQLLRQLSDLAAELQLEVLYEIHTEHELERVLKLSPDIVGINSRNLKSFTTDQEVFYKLKAMIPDEVAVVAESGIQSAEEMVSLKQAGFSGFLIGSRFMETSQPHLACRQLAAAYSKILKDSTAHA